MSEQDKEVAACAASAFFGAIGFGLWHSSFGAGLFAFFFLDAIYMIARFIQARK